MSIQLVTIKTYNLRLYFRWPCARSLWNADEVRFYLRCSFSWLPWLVLLTTFRSSISFIQDRHASRSSKLTLLIYANWKVYLDEALCLLKGKYMMVFIFWRQVFLYILKAIEFSSSSLANRLITLKLFILFVLFYAVKV